MAQTDVTIKIGAETQEAISKMKNLVKTLIGAGGLYYGLKKIADMMYDLGEAASRQQNSFNKLYIALQGNIEATKQFAHFADEMQDSLNVSNDVLMKSVANFNMLAGLTEEELERLTPLVIDFANTFGMDLNAAFLLVGKTLSSSTNALTRYGIQIDMSKNKGEKLNEIIQKLSKFSGAAAAETETFTGKLKHLANTFDDTKKTAGEFLNSSAYFSEFMTGLEGFVIFVQQDVAPAFGAVVEGIIFVVNAGAKAVADLLGMIVRGWNEMIAFLIEKVKKATDLLGVTPTWLNTLAQSTKEITENANLFEQFSENIDQTLLSISEDLFVVKDNSDLITKNAEFAKKHLENAAKAIHMQKNTEENLLPVTEKRTEELNKQAKEIKKANEGLNEQKGAMQDLSEEIGEMGKSMMSAMGIPSGAGGLAGAIGIILQFVQDVFNGVIGVLRDFAMGDLVKGIENAFITAITLIAEYYAGPLGAQIAGAFAGLIDTALHTIWDKANLLIPFKETFSSAFSMTEEEFSKKIPEWENRAKNKLKNFMDNLPALLDIWTHAAENLRDFWVAHKEKLRVEIRSFVFYLTPVLIDIARIVLPTIYQMMVDAYWSAIEGIVLYWYVAIKDMIVKLGEDFFDIGGIIGDGIISKARDIGKEIAEEVKKAIKLPDKGKVEEKTEGWLSDLESKLGVMG